MSANGRRDLIRRLKVKLLSIPLWIFSFRKSFTALPAV